MLLEDLTRDYQSRVDTALDQWLPAESIQPSDLHEAMRYAVLGGGKRLRPILVYMTGTALGISPERLDGPACAVELVHTYSLIHDDLPVMDNDDLRRGRPTCHKIYGEALALLAGDALQPLAFHILSHDPQIQVNAERRLKMIEILALAAGSRGMAGGQAIDLASVGKRLDLAQLENMHIHKTGALIRASVLIGALSKPGINNNLVERLDHYAKFVGLAFQVHDDILDVEGDTAVLGKQAGADQALDKPTYPAVLGLAGARQKARELHESAIECLAPLGTDFDPLRWISAYIIDRTH
ncbi:MAG: farnesyl diphosphate synthase [Gammaproteobacteria bacterium]|nr:MAG: farnesyl diphosphate synthase [Gammaproteobacteria bacterium]TND07337.1 MAG: farnesyl diphosphate synthase [Gammaproteobacteria bacterium]